MNVEKGLSVGGEKLKAWRFVGGEAVGICIVYRNNGGDKLTTKNVLFLTNNNYSKKKCHFICMLQKTLYLCICKQKTRRDRYDYTEYIGKLAVLHIIRVVVVAPRGEKVSCM